PAGLVSRWPGEGNSNDLVGGNNGTLGAGVGFTAGKVGQGFNLGNSVVTVPDAPNLSLTAVTLEGWILVRPNAPVPQMAVGAKGRNYNLLLDFIYDPAPLFELYTTSGVYSSPFVPFTLNSFHHVAVTADGQ